MGAKHTPGPWAVEDPMSFELTIVEANKPTHEWVFIASLSLPERRGDPDAFPRTVVAANARLIAAAPDLLQALIDLNAGILPSAESNASGNPEWEYVSKRINAARAAIAKATGAS